MWSMTRWARAVMAAAVAAILALSTVPALAQGFYYKEIEKDGRIYVFNNAGNAERFEKSGEVGVAITMPGAGPKGETIVGDNERALQLYFFKHNIAMPVPDPPQAPPPAPPWRISGLVFGDYYGFVQNHLPAWEDQHGMWIRRAYFTYDHTFSPAVTTRLRLEANGNGKLAGGSATPYIKDAYVRWTFYGRQALMIGIQPTLTFDFIESVWGLRHIEKTPLDLYRMDSSRDTGFTLSGPLNATQSVRYALQYGNESGNNGETDKFKATRAAVRYETNPGFSVEGVFAHFFRNNDADRTTAQVFLGYRNPRTRAGFQYSFQKRRAANNIGADADLDVFSGFVVREVVRAKTSVFARLDRYDDACSDCAGIDYLPIATNAPFTLAIVGLEYNVHPSFRVSPNIQFVGYGDPVTGAKPRNDAVGRLTFYWVW